MSKRKGTEAPEIAEWLTRFEKRFGVNQTRESLQKMQSARSLFFDELGYNVTRRQFEALQQEKNERQQEEISSGVKSEQGRQYRTKDGKSLYQTNYRDTVTGRFVRYAK